MTNYVYTLSDPRCGTVRYVGRSSNPTSRFKAHLKTYYYSRTTAKEEWITELTAAGLVPTMTVIDSADDGVSIRQKEQYWINKYMSEGCDLLNQTGAFNSTFVVKIPLPQFHKMHNLLKARQMTIRELVCSLIDNVELP